MAYGLADVVNQRRMIDESEAEEEFKQVQRGKLDALLALAEAHDCRRARLLAYFGESSTPCASGQNSCDNCRHPPATWDATEAARKALSCVYRFHQNRGQRFGAVHLIDVLRGKRSEKVEQYGHAQLSTFGIGADLSEAQWRAVLRQLIALGHLRIEGEYNTLELTPSARAVLRGEVPMLLRQASEKTRRTRAERKPRNQGKVPQQLGAAAQERFAALRLWRTQVAREHNLPPYVVFHDATLAEMAQLVPDSLAALSRINGVGRRKLEAYGHEILRLLKAEE